MRRTIAFLIFAFFTNFSFAFGMTPAEEKRLFQDIAEIKATLKVFMEQTDKRFRDLREDINKRFEQVDKRFELVDKRFEDMNKRFDEMMNFLWILTAIFTTLTATVIGFAYWDRRTIIKKSRDEAIEIIEKEGRLRDLINALRELAKREPQVKSVLEQYNLL